MDNAGSDFKWLDSGRVSLRYQLAGDGPATVVLLHEMGGTMESWDDTIADLSRRFRVLRYDSRGAGLSEKHSGKLEIETLTDDLADLLDGLGLKHKVVIVGCAVGAAVALKFSLRYPERTAGVIAMSPAVGIDPERRAATLERIEELERLGSRVRAEGSIHRSFPAELRENDGGRYDAYRARWMANDAPSVGAMHRMLVDLTLEKDLARIACPVLVVGGELDAARPPEVSRKVADAIPGARFMTIRSGHFMPVQTPEPVVRLISDFAEELMGIEEPVRR